MISSGSKKTNLVSSDSSGVFGLANLELLRAGPNTNLDMLRNFGLVTLGTSSSTETIVFNGEEITSLDRALMHAQQQTVDHVAKLKKSIEDTRQARDECPKNRADKAAGIKETIENSPKLPLEIAPDSTNSGNSSAERLDEQIQMSLHDSDFGPAHSEDVNSQLLVKINKLEEDVRKLQRKSKDRQRERSAAATKTKELMDKLGIGQNNEADEKPRPVLSNQSHRDICFHYDDRSGLYIYIWEAKKRSLFPAKKKSAKPDGQAEKIKFDEFILANCLFGASLLGIDGSGKKYPMIDHNLRVDSTIELIEVDNSKLHPYEMMMFASFEKLVALMRHIGTKEFVVRYHLPVVDYMLYGLHSYIVGVMSFAAFDEYVEAVKQRGIFHANILTGLAQTNEINLLIESPFDNFAHDINNMSAEKLLQLIRLDDFQLEKFKTGDGVTESSKKWLRNLEKHFNHQRKDLCDFKDLIDTLAMLDDFDDGRREAVELNIDGGQVEQVDSSKSYTPPTYEIRMLLEKLCIENILKRLRGVVPSVVDGERSCHNAMHADIWNEIEDKKIVTSYDPLSRLFQVANTTLLALRTGKVKCSLLPIDEKPIPESYQKIFAEHFGNITCLSWLPPVKNCCNSADDLAKNKPNYKNNLFRLRTDLFPLDEVALKTQMKIAMKLDSDFWFKLDKLHSELPSAFTTHDHSSLPSSDSSQCGEGNDGSCPNNSANLSEILSPGVNGLISWIPPLNRSGELLRPASCPDFYCLDSAPMFFSGSGAVASVGPLKKNDRATVALTDTNSDNIETPKSQIIHCHGASSINVMGTSSCFIGGAGAFNGSSKYSALKKAELIPK